MSSEAQPKLVRAIGRWSLVALMLNSIIGSGIFGQPSIVAGLLGAASPFAYLGAAAGMGVIIACFAEVASRFREAGGPYLYARLAFGRLVGIEIAWLFFLSRLSGAAAGADLFVDYLARFWPLSERVMPRLVILALLLATVAIVNYRGVSTGVRLSNFFTVAKLLPLLAFAGAGLFFVRATNLAIHSWPGPGKWFDATLVSIYAFGGFEIALVPMSEAKDPQRDAPFALFTGMAAVTLLYILIQVVVMGIYPEAAQTGSPLAAAASLFMGSSGAALMTLGAMISVYGYQSSVILNIPRLTFALSEQEDFPAFFGAVHPRFRTPHVSIITFALLAWVLAAAGSFRQNLAVSVVGRLFPYASTCAALLAFRKMRPAEGSFRLTAGPFFALLGLAFSVVLISRMHCSELLVVSATAAIALINWAWAKRRR